MVENALYAEPGVQEAAAVGVPDKRLGELVTALVTLKPGYAGSVTEASLLATAKRCVSRDLVVAHADGFKIITSLPRFAVPVMIMIHEGDFGEYLHLVHNLRAGTNVFQITHSLGR